MTRPLRSFIAMVTVAAALAAGCSPVPEIGEASIEETYDYGVRAAAAEDYLVAAEAFKRVMASAPLDELADDAQMGLADAYREMRDFAMAEGEYRRLLSDYPRSPLVAEAEFKLGLTFFEQSLPAQLDQATTARAIRQIERFLATYPESEFAGEAGELRLDLRSRLAEKEYRAALLYQTLKNEEAARVYLRSVAAEYPDTPWAPRALLELARSHSREGATALALDAYERIVRDYPGTEEAASAEAERSGL